MLREARAENALRVERIRASRLAAAEARAARRSALLESLSADWVTPYAELLDLTRRTGDPVIAGPTSAWQRSGGKNWPVYQTEQELNLLRAPARVLLATNGYAQGLVEGLTSYVLGPGCTYRVAKADDRDDLPRAAVDAAQDVVDRVLERAQWFGGEQPGIEEELFGRSVEDGEFVLAHYPREDGWTDYRIHEPECLTQPPGSGPEYAFGILTPPDDAQDVRGYYLQHGDTPGEGDEFDADEVTHFRRNVRRGMKRGVTDFCFDTYDALYLAARLRTNLGDTAAQQAAIVAVRQHDSGSKEDIQAFVDEDSGLTEREPLTGAELALKLRRRGSWEDVPKGMNYVPGPIANSTPIHVQVLDACLRGAGQKWQAPPWIMSGDLNAMNYATSLTAESPFVRTVQRRQRGYCEAFRRPVWFALRHYVRTRGLRDRMGKVWSWEEVEGRLKLQVTAPSPETRDRLQDAQRAQIEIPLGVQSPQNYMQEMGRVPDRIAADLKASKQDGTAPQKPGQPTPAGDQQQGDGQPNELRGTVGGLQAITALQTAYYAGQIPQAAAVANLVTVFGFTDEEAAGLVPAVKPVDRAGEAQQESRQQGAAPGPGGDPGEPPADDDPGAGGGDDLASLFASEEDAAGIDYRDLLEAASAGRREGEVWKGTSGRYFTLKGGRVVPAKDPNKAQAAADKKAAADKAKADKAAAKQQAAKGKADAKAQTAAGQAAAKAVASKLAKNEPVSSDEMKALGDHILTLKADELSGLAKQLGLKKSGVKKDVAARVLDAARAKAGAKADDAPAKGEPKKEPADAGVSSHVWGKSYRADLQEANRVAKAGAGASSEADVQAFVEALRRVPDDHLDTVLSGLGLYQAAGASRETLERHATDESRSRMEDRAAIAARAKTWDTGPEYPRDRPDHKVAQQLATHAESRAALADILKATPAEHRKIYDERHVAKRRESAMWNAMVKLEADRGKDDPDFLLTRARWVKAHARVKATDEAFEAATRAAREAVTGRLKAADPMPMEFENHKGATLKAPWLLKKLRLADDFEISKPFDPKPEQQRGLEAAREFLGKIVEAGGASLKIDLRESPDGRAYFLRGGGKRTDVIAFGSHPDAESQAATTVHELGHAIEYGKAGVQAAANRFLEYRLNGEKEIDIGTVPGGESMKGEMGRKDKFDRHLPKVSAYYVGKQYYDTVRDKDGKAVKDETGVPKKTPSPSTEVLSVGLECLYKDPVGFMRNDPEYAQFVIMCLRKK